MFARINYQGKDYIALLLSEDEFKQLQDGCFLNAVVVDDSKLQAQQNNGVFVPGSLSQYTKVLKTPRADKMFPLAVKEGLMSVTENGYKWHDTKALLAYFLNKVYCPNEGDVFPDKALCLLFGETRLSKAKDQLSLNKNGNGKPRGYYKVDRNY